MLSTYRLGVFFMAREMYLFSNLLPAELFSRRLQSMLMTLSNGIQSTSRACKFLIKVNRVSACSLWLAGLLTITRVLRA